LVEKKMRKLLSQLCGEIAKWTPSSIY
jgi:hypothetical protein